MKQGLPRAILNNAVKNAPTQKNKDGNMERRSKKEIDRRHAQGRIDLKTGTVDVIGDVGVSASAVHGTFSSIKPLFHVLTIA